MPPPIYALMDGRAAYDPDAATVLVASEDPAEICQYANDGTHGDGCLVVKECQEVMWAWFATGKWRMQ